MPAACAGRGGPGLSGRGDRLRSGRRSGRGYPMTATIQEPVKVSPRGGRLIASIGLATLFAAAIGALMLVLSGRFESKVVTAPGGAEHAWRSAPTATGLVRRISRPRRESAVGTIRAVAEAVVASKILARVLEVRVTAGRAVKQGEVLVVLDEADLLARLEQAHAAVSAAQARLEQAEVDQKRARISGRASRSPRASSTGPIRPCGPRTPSSSTPAAARTRPGSSSRTRRSAPRSAAGSSTRRSTPATRSAPVSRC